MSSRGFGPVIWAGAVAGAALGFYLVSLNVASERAELEEVEGRIALAQRDIRLLQTEIGTRGRLAQLERWNVKFIRLSAPTADQFVEGGFHLATLVAPRKKPAIDAPVVLASAPAEQAIPQQPKLTGDSDERHARSAGEMMHVASYSVPERPAAMRPPVARPAVPQPDVKKPLTDTLQRPATAPAKPAKSAAADPLAPLSTARAKAKGGAPAASAGTISLNRQAKDSDTH